MRFEIGDIVKIAKTCEYYGADKYYNPKDTEGEIMSNDGNRMVPDNPHTIRVNWDGAGDAYFREQDLRLVRRLT